MQNVHLNLKSSRGFSVSEQYVSQDLNIGYSTNDEFSIANLPNVIWSIILLLLIFLFVFYQKYKGQRRFLERQGERILAQNKELKLLLSEIHHRVKNNLQMVIGMLEIQRQKIDDADTKTAFEDISRKIHSIALIHEQLYKSKDLNIIGLRDYLEKMMAHFKNFNSAVTHINSKIESPNIHLNLDTMIPLGIICAELLNNSIKYFCPDNGDLDISVQIKKENKTIQLRYADNGVGYDSGKLEYSEEGIGNMLIKSMVRQLKGQFKTYNKKGAVFKMEFQEKVTTTI